MMLDQKRLLVIGHAYMERTAQRKLDALSRRGLEVGLLVPARWSLPPNGLFSDDALTPTSHYRSVRLYAAPVFRSGHIASFIFEPGAIRRALDDFRPDIVQVEQETYSFAAAQVVRATSRRHHKSIVFGWENLERPLPIVQRWAERIVLSRADAVIAGNRAGIDRSRRKGFAGPTCVLPQIGVDPALFHPSARPAARTSTGFTAGFFGRLVPEKGVETLLRAAALVIREGVDVRLIVTGAGPERRRFEALARNLGLASLVEWLDTIPHQEVPARMSVLDVLVLPSTDTPHWQEQFGLVLAQAMAMGIPVLGSRSGAIPDVIGWEELLFPQGDAKALACLLARLVKDEDWRREASAWGLARALKHFTVDAIVHRLCRFYEHLLSGGAQMAMADYGYADDLRASTIEVSPG